MRQPRRVAHKTHSVLRLAKLEVHSPELVSSQKGGRLVFSDRKHCPVIRAFFGSIELSMHRCVCLCEATALTCLSLTADVLTFSRKIT